MGFESWFQPFKGLHPVYSESESERTKQKHWKNKRTKENEFNL